MKAPAQDTNRPISDIRLALAVNSVLGARMRAGASATREDRARRHRERAEGAWLHRKATTGEDAVALIGVCAVMTCYIQPARAT